MAENSKIEWTHHTFNPWRGCTKVSAGCKHCYAETMSKRNPGTLGVWGKRGSRPVAVESYWKQPIKWNKDAKTAGERRRVFCASLADVFEGRDSMPESAWQAVSGARIRLFNLIDATPDLDWLLLTKRPENILEMLGDWGVNTPANLWIGTSVENQEEADRRIPLLLTVPAKVRFLSCEPLLGPVDLRSYLHGIQWVIVGGESGAGEDTRPMDPEWAQSLRDQCQFEQVAFHFKQWGEWYPMFLEQTDNGRHIATAFTRIGKAKAGRILDGRTWDELPA